MPVVVYCALGMLICPLLRILVPVIKEINYRGGKPTVVMTIILRVYCEDCVYTLDGM